MSNNQSSASSDVVDGSAGCHQERPTGSNIGREVCRTPDDVNRDREEARKFLHPGRTPPARSESGTP